MRLVDLSFGRKAPSADRRLTSVAETAAFRFIYSLEKKFEGGRFRKITVEIVDKMERVEADRTLPSVLVLDTRIDLSKLNLDDVDNTSAFLLTHLFDRLLEAAPNYDFDVDALRMAYEKAQSFGRDLEFPTRIKASSPDKKRTARIVFSANGMTTTALVRHGPARQPERSVSTVYRFEGAPGWIGLAQFAIKWLDETTFTINHGDEFGERHSRVYTCQ